MLRGQWGNCAGWPGDGSHAGHLVVGVDLCVMRDVLGPVGIWNDLKRCPNMSKPLLSQFLSPGPLVPLMFSKMSSKHIKASPVILYTYIYIHNYICGYFQLIPKYVHGIQELETRYDSRRRVSACFAGCPRYEAWWGLIQKRQTQ